METLEKKGGDGGGVWFRTMYFQLCGKAVPIWGEKDNEGQAEANELS